MSRNGTRVHDAIVHESHDEYGKELSNNIMISLEYVLYDWKFES